MGRRRAMIAGRESAFAALDAALDDATAQGRLVVVRGPVGIGKSALLAAVAERWRSAGVLVIRASLSPEAGDDFGFGGLIEAVRDRFEDVGSRRVVESLSALSGLSSHRRAAPSAGPGWDVTRTVLELGGMFQAMAADRRVALVVDEADAVTLPALALRSAVWPGCLVVAACREHRGPTSARQDPRRAAAEQLETVADLFLDLPQLAPDSIAAMLARRCGMPLNEELLDALRSALGSFAGVPGTVLSTIDHLESTGRLATPRATPDQARGHLCLIDPSAPIPLAPDHELVRTVRELGAVALRLATTAAVVRFGVDDLPLLVEATTGDLDVCGRVLDRLVEVGVLTADPDGGLSVSCAALGTRLVTDLGPTPVARLHRAFAAAMFRRVGYGQAANEATLADHVSSAGQSIPVDPRTAVRLVDVAAEATERDPERAATWLRAALWHADGGPTADQVLDRLLRVLVRTGKYGRLSEVVSTVAARAAVIELADHQREDLAAAAMLAAVHCGVPVPKATTHAIIGNTPGSRDPFEFAARWFGGMRRTGSPAGTPVSGSAVRPDGQFPPNGQRPGGDPPLLSSEELAVIAGVVGNGLLTTPVSSPRPADDFLIAGSAADLVSVFQLALGQRYGAPSAGALAAHRRLLDSYARGDFPSALAAARETELCAGPVTAVHQLTRAYAAQMRALRGESTRAARWLQPVPDRPPYLAIRWWVSASGGFRADAEHGAEAIRKGVLALRRQLPSGSRLGLEQALVRLAELTVLAGEPGPALAALRRIDADHSLAMQPLTTQTALLLRAVLDCDPDAAQASADMVRARGDRPALVSTCLVAAALDQERRSDRPQWLLLEAYEIASSFGSPYLRHTITALMRKRGISPPRARTARDTFSAVERDIIALIRMGWTNRQIAGRVRVSEKTVETYVTRLFARTGCRSRVELATASLTGPGPGAASWIPEVLG